MIDIHTHILPGIDDGSKSVLETTKMLETMKGFGVDKVVATPHFYGEINTIENFLDSRRASYESIKDIVPEGMEIILGAEVFLDYELHKKDVRKLVIGDTDYLLLEMPYRRWEPWVYDEIFKISVTHNLEIIIAHLDRYIDIVNSDNIKKLLKMGLKYQVNIDNLGGFMRKSNAVNLMRSGRIHFVGSDCHNTQNRPPCMGKAVNKIKSKFGDEYVEYYMSNAEKMLKNLSIN